MTQNYNARLTPALAAKMIEEGSDGLWPKAPPGVPQVSYGNRACAEMASLSRHGDAPFDTIVMCGGRLYIDVMRALVHDIMQKTDTFSFDADGKLNPLFRDADAEVFVSEITGQDVKVCRGWLRHDWPLS